MGPTEVLNQYLELCNNTSVYLQYHLASNSVLEWYGRTIRGRHKIQQFFRHDVCQQYEHNFQSPVECGPIEQRPTHMQTKELHVLADECLQITKMEQNDDDEDREPSTPPQQNRPPELPKLDQGRSFLALSSSDEDDFDTSREGAVTPPLGIQPLDFDEPLSKRRRTKTDEITFPPLPNVDDYFRKTNTNSRSQKSAGCTSNPRGRASTSSTTCTSNIPESEAAASGYSQLKYLEVGGIIQRLNQTKHRGVTGGTANLNSSQTSSSAWERETKLKLSYRVRAADQHIQFALIIYEHITTRHPSSKRNLLLEFNDVEADGASEQQQQVSRRTPSAKKDKVKEVKRKTPLRRNLRLF